MCRVCSQVAALSEMLRAAFMGASPSSPFKDSPHNPRYVCMGSKISNINEAMLLSKTHQDLSLAIWRVLRNLPVLT